MANSVITLDNVSFRYPDAGRDALSGVSLSIEAGSFIAVLGHNGSGKSTLAKLLNAILVPTEGTVTVKGMDTRSEENLLNVRRRTMWRLRPKTLAFPRRRSAAAWTRP